MPKVLSLAREWAGAPADRLRAVDLDSALIRTERPVLVGIPGTSVAIAISF
jgi:hypothetical protein